MCLTLDSTVNDDLVFLLSLHRFSRFIKVYLDTSSTTTNTTLAAVCVKKVCLSLHRYLSIIIQKSNCGQGSVIFFWDRRLLCKGIPVHKVSIFTVFIKCIINLLFRFGLDGRQLRKSSFQPLWRRIQAVITNFIWTCL
jgi:hypothetical protein